MAQKKKKAGRGNSFFSEALALVGLKQKKKGLFGKKKTSFLKASRKKSLRFTGGKKNDSAPLAVLIGAAAALAAALPFWLLAPGSAKKEEKAKFTGRTYAHRGLYEEDQSVPENSLPAFRRALEAGYGIELDVQLTRDGRAVVFHDDDLLRACGDPRRVDAVDWEELRTLRLFGTRRTIPLFREVLSLVAGRVPLIIELKSGRRNGELCRSVRSILEVYEGDACIQSFDPRIVRWFRRHDPARMRGQLAQPAELFEKKGLSRVGSAVLGRTLFNAAARPHFISYRIGEKPAAVRLAESLGALKFAWTSREIGDTEGGKYDAVIFEFYRPPTKL